MSINFFDSTSAAARYAAGRPYLHPTAIGRMQSLLSLVASRTRALDVGCGTGLSSLALKPVADSIIGVDASIEMLALAPADPAIRYVVANAEQLPFAHSEFDLMTLSQAFHWLDRDVFLNEAKRVLRPRGWMVVYDNYFTGTMKDNERFQAWFRANYPARFPPPARARLTFSDEDSKNSGFHLHQHDRYTGGWRFSVEQLVDYLVTHSNVIAAVEHGHENLDEIRHWLSENLTPYFSGAGEAELIFDGVIWYLRRSE